VCADLAIRGLHVSIGEKPILKGLDLDVNRGEVHAIMGPNGSGKSTLANALMGNPAYQVTAGEIWLKGEDVLKLAPDERARLGLFLAFQYPSAIPGVSVANFLRTAINARRGLRQAGNGGSPAVSAREFRALLQEGMAMLKMDPGFASRYVNDGFSGGEKKRLEILQMALLKPEMAILDEPDSGLDIDALRIVAEGVNRLLGPDLGVLVITHYQRILNYIKPGFVHILLDGRIALSGGPELALQLEEHGYDWVRE
jgi:Fe-S cluster assembly ATP-binding protein